MWDDAGRAVAELAASQHRAFTRRQAAELNFHRNRVATAIRTGWLAEPYPGVLSMAGSRPTWRERTAAATLAGGCGAVASHRSAARLHGLDGFTRCDAVEISVSRTHRWRHVETAICHHVTPFEPSDLVSVDAIACTGLARTLADLGAVVERSEVRRALIDARRRNVSLRWLHDTVDRLHRPGPTGTGVLMRELAMIPSEGRVSDSWFEELVAQIVADPSLPPIERQFEVRRADGTLVARIDVAMPSIRLGLEAHSRQFHFGPDAEPLDEQRDLAAAACGWELAYLGWYVTKRPAEVVDIIRHKAAARRRDVSGDSSSSPSDSCEVAGPGRL